MKGNNKIIEIMGNLELEKQLELIRQNPYNIMNIKNPRDELYTELIKMNGLLIEYVPKEKQTKDMYLQAIKKNGLTIAHIPKENLTEELCLEAVKNNGLSILHVPKEYQTNKVCLEAIKENEFALSMIPKEKQNEEVYLGAIKQNGYVISYVPKEKQSERLCLEAVRQNGDNIKNIHKENQSPQVCIEAIKNSPDAIQYIEKEQQTEDLCINSVKHNGDNIIFVYNKTPKVCLYAFLNDFNVIMNNDIKNKIENMINSKEKLNNIVFFNDKSNKTKITKLFNVDLFEFIQIDLKSLNYLNEYILYENNNNHFVLSDNTDISVLKEIALSNNELIIIEKNGISDIHRKIANKII